jgi:hypothetical protein
MSISMRAQVRISMRDGRLSPVRSIYDAQQRSVFDFWR